MSLMPADAGPPADAGQQKLSAGTEQLVSVHAAAEQGPWPPADAEQQPWQTSAETEQLPVQVLLITSSLSAGQGDELDIWHPGMALFRRATAECMALWPSQATPTALGPMCTSCKENPAGTMAMDLSQVMKTSREGQGLCFTVQASCSRRPVRACMVQCTQLS